MTIKELENPPQWLLDANTAFANVEIIDGIVHWNGGVWRDGIWHNATLPITHLPNAIFPNAIFPNTAFKKATVPCAVFPDAVLPNAAIPMNNSIYDPYAGELSISIQ